MSQKKKKKKKDSSERWNLNKTMFQEQPILLLRTHLPPPLCVLGIKTNPNHPTKIRAVEIPDYQIIGQWDSESDVRE